MLRPYGCAEAKGETMELPALPPRRRSPTPSARFRLFAAWSVLRHRVHPGRAALFGAIVDGIMRPSSREGRTVAECWQAIGLHFGKRAAGHSRGHAQPCPRNPEALGLPGDTGSPGPRRGDARRPRPAAPRDACVAPTTVGATQDPRRRPCPRSLAPSSPPPSRRINASPVGCPPRRSGSAGTMNT